MVIIVVLCVGKTMVIYCKVFVSTISHKATPN